MSLIGLPDFGRPIDFATGSLYYPYGGGGFPLVPGRCGVVNAATGAVDLHLDLIRALDPRLSRAVFSCTFAADYASEDALVRARQLDPNGSIVATVLTDWWFRVLPSATLGAPVELVAPAIVSSDGLGTARFMATLGIDTGVILESMLQSQVPLRGVAEAGFDGVSPRLSVVVRFESQALIAGLLKSADPSGALPRRAIVDYFAQESSRLPLRLDGAVDDASRPRFAEAMADRVVARYGRYVPSQSMDDAPVVELQTVMDPTTVMWALAQPFVARRRAVMSIDLLSDAQQQVAKRGIESVVQRTNLTSLPPLGQTRVTALCMLPPVRAAVDALGVTLTFPPRPPERPQAVTATALFDTPDAMAVIDVTLSPGEPLEYQYQTFAVVTDDQGTRQIDGESIRAEGSPLHLSTNEFPMDFAVVEVAPALGQIAVVSGACSYEDMGIVHQQPFTIDSGAASVAIAVPRTPNALSIDGYAIARDGSGRLRIGPIESPRVKLDLTSFREYGPQQIEIRCVFDDAATLQAISLLPADRTEAPDTVSVVTFTPSEPVKTFQWSAHSPFTPGLRYRPFDAPQAPWTDIPAGRGFTVYSSQLRRQERLPVRRETAEAGPAAPESPVDPVATSPAFDVTDLLLFDGIADASKKYFVPQYALDTQTVSGQDRYRVSMSQQNGKPTLEVNLVPAPDPSIAEQASGATEYPHRVVVVLDFLVTASSGARKSLEFQEITRTANVVKATLTFATLAERDDVYRALTDDARDAHLTVQRFFDVRVPSRGGVTPGGHGVGGTGRPPWKIFLPDIARPILFTRPLPVPPPPDPVIVPAVLTRATPALLSTRMMLRPAVERTTVIRESAVLAPAAAIARTITMRPVGHFAPALPVPQLAFTDTQEAAGIIRCRLSVTNWSDYSDDFFAPSPDLPPCGLNRSASRTWVDIFDADTNARMYGFCALTTAKQLNELWFALPAGKPLPAHVRVTLTDRRTNVTQSSNAVDTAATEGYTPLPPHDIRMQLDHIVTPSPFAFAPALHGYIFQGVTAGSTGTNQLVRWQLSWKGTFHTYLQDATRPSVVYVFADEFKIARRPDAPYSPYATVRVTSRPDGSDTDVVFDYVVAPSTDTKRLEDARTQLLADARFGASSFEFQPFLTTDVRFFIDRPAASGSVREQRTDASVVLQGVLKDTLTMSLADFRLLFDAMEQRTASLFLGHVEIDVPNDATQTIQFTARMDNLAGEVFTYSMTPADGGVQVTARNDIESPLSVQAIDATMIWKGERRHALVQGSGIPTPSLAPGAAIQFTLTPDTPWPAGAEPEVVVDLNGVRAVPDPEAIWNSILDRTTVEFFKFVTVKALTSYFEPVAGRETERIVSVLVDFEGGGTGELNASTLEAKVRVDYSIDDVILHRPASGSYRYTVTVIRENGQQDKDSVPRESASQTFYVSVTK